MKTLALALATAFLFLAPHAHAKAGKEATARKVSSAAGDMTKLPREVLSAQGQPSFKEAYAKLQAAFNEDPNHDHKNIILTGYKITSDKGEIVELHYGTTTDMWPTGVRDLGTITVPLRMFPDGILGFESYTAATFEKAK